MHCTCTCQFPWIQNSKLCKIKFRIYNWEERAFAMLIEWTFFTDVLIICQIEARQRFLPYQTATCSWLGKLGLWRPNDLFHGSKTTFTSCRIHRYIICVGATYSFREKWNHRLTKRNFILIYIFLIYIYLNIFLNLVLTSKILQYRNKLLTAYILVAYIAIRCTDK